MPAKRRASTPTTGTEDSGELRSDRSLLNEHNLATDDVEAGPRKRRRIDDEQSSDDGPTAVTPVEVVTGTGITLDHTAFPHIFNQIVENLIDGFEDDRDGVYSTMLALRASSSALRSSIDNVLFEHVVIRGKLPALYSRFGRIPSMCNDKSLKRTHRDYIAAIKDHVIRVCDFGGVDCFNTPWKSAFVKQLGEVLDPMTGVKVFRHRGNYDSVYKNLGFKPVKLVRFVDVTQMWHSRVDDLGPPNRLGESADTIVVNMRFTHDWEKWTEFINVFVSRNVRKIVFIFEAVDDPLAENYLDDPPWKEWRNLRPFKPILQKLVWELQFEYSPSRFDMVFVDLPQTMDDTAGQIRKCLSDELRRPPELEMDGLAFTDEQVNLLMSKIKFLSKQEYVATLSKKEYIEDFLWYAPEEAE